MIYLFILIVLIFACIKFDFSTNRHSSRVGNNWYKFVFVLLVCTAGLRYKVGGDTIIYMMRFDEIPFLDEIPNYDFLLSGLDPLWIIFSSIFKTINDDFFFFQFFHVLIINSVIFWFIRKYTVYKFTALLIYFLFFYIYFNMEILRESLAICIFLLAYPSLEKRNLLRYYLLAIIAFLFHSSAIILLIFPLLQRVKFNRTNLVIVLVAFVSILVVSIYMPSILNYVLFTDRLLSKFETYSNVTANLNATIVYSITYLIIPLLFIKLNWRINKLDHKFKELYMLYTLLVLLFLIINGFLRFLNYLAPFMIVYFADLLNSIYKSYRFKHMKREVVILLIVITFIPKTIYYFEDTSRIVNGTHRYNIWFPYSSIFTKEEYYYREIIFFERMDESYDRHN
ncbi:EpsG family protein [Bizionia paragorgiae]|uniref:EpsG family protein n=2 Tax=Bizionia paragorgiae TaxID=283786 RepID=A0A1H4BBT8_BIZPA|nr:EpsG family protein [Bizionia paragorgiae]